jgi:hypothetical protein
VAAILVIVSMKQQQVKENNMVDRKYNIISGTAYWASVVAPNTTFDSDGVWEVNVCNLDEDAKATLEADGITIRNKGDEKGDYVQIKRRSSIPIIPPCIIPLLEMAPLSMLSTVLMIGSSVIRQESVPT